MKNLRLSNPMFDWVNQLYWDTPDETETQSEAETETATETETESQAEAQTEAQTENQAETEPFFKHGEESFTSEEVTARLNEQSEALKILAPLSDALKGGDRDAGAKAMLDLFGGPNEPGEDDDPGEFWKEKFEGQQLMNEIDTAFTNAATKHGESFKPDDVKKFMVENGMVHTQIDIAVNAMKAESITVDNEKVILEKAKVLAGEMLKKHRAGNLSSDSIAPNSGKGKAFGGTIEETAEHFGIDLSK